MTPLDPLVLHTERLTLRPLVAPDADDLFALFSDPQVMRYWLTLPWTDRAQAVHSIAADERSRHEGDALRLGLEETASARIVGTCSLFALHVESRRAELGYALARAHWGRGFMHEALRAFLTYAFGTLGLHRIEADIDPRNTASARTLERLGFVREGLLRERWIVAGEVSDTALYGLLQSDWPV